jgi:hypothetical protein
MILKSTLRQSLFLSQNGHYLAWSGQDSEGGGFAGGGLSRLRMMCGI